MIEYAALDFLGYQASWWKKVRLFAMRFIGLFATVLFILMTTVWLATMELQVTTTTVVDGGNATITTTSSRLNNPCPKCRYFNCVPFPSQANPWWYCDDCATDSAATLYKTETTTTTTTADGEDDNDDSTNNNTTVVTAYYTRIDLTCPNGQVVPAINVTDRNITDKAVLVDDLPDYCRDYCDTVYAY